MIIIIILLLLIINNEKSKINNRRNRTAKSRKNRNTWRKGKLQVLGNIGCGHQTSGDEKRIRKQYFKQRRKLSETKLCSINLIKGVNTGAAPRVRYSRPFLKWMGDGTQRKGPKDKKADNHAKVFQLRDDTDRFYVPR